jgi:hypothetical protein
MQRRPAVALRVLRLCTRFHQCRSRHLMPGSRCVVQGSASIAVGGIAQGVQAILAALRLSRAEQRRDEGSVAILRCPVQRCALIRVPSANVGAKVE